MSSTKPIRGEHIEGSHENCLEPHSDLSGVVR